MALLDFTDVEQRILTLNKIDDRIQEDLLKWKEEYNSAQVDLNATSNTSYQHLQKMFIGKISNSALRNISVVMIAKS